MADQKQLDMLKQGAVTWNQWKEKHPEIRPDLIFADLHGAILYGAILYGANLSGPPVGFSSFGDVDLSVVKNLEKVEHGGPSTIGIDTIIRSRGLETRFDLALINLSVCTTNSCLCYLNPLLPVSGPKRGGDCL